MQLDIVTFLENVVECFIQKRIKAAEAESKLKQVYIPN